MYITMTCISATKQAIKENTTLKEDFYRVCQVRIQQQIFCPRKLVDDIIIQRTFVTGY